MTSKPRMERTRTFITTGSPPTVWDSVLAWGGVYCFLEEILVGINVRRDDISENDRGRPLCQVLIATFGGKLLSCDCGSPCIGERGRLCSTGNDINGRTVA